MPVEFEIKRATINDIPIILDFIRKLAEFEKLSHEVFATEASLKESLFGEKEYAEIVIGYLGVEPVSFALFFNNYSTFLGQPGIYLEDLFVESHARGKGIGKQMLAYLADLAKI